MKHMTAADRITIDHCDDRFRHGADQFLHFQYLQAGHSVFPYITAFPLDMLVSAGAEGLITGSGQDDHINILVFMAEPEGVRHLHRSSRRKCIAITRTINCNTGNPFVEVEEDIFIFLQGRPFSLCCHLIYFLVDDNRFV